jgi:tetratricopeptide (TPR) repeat protein
MVHVEDSEVWTLLEEIDKLYDSEASFEEIIEHYDNAILKKPNEPYLLYQKGGFLWDTCNFEESIKLMDRVLEIDPQYILALRMKSDCLSQIGKYDEAKKYWDKIPAHTRKEYTNN